MKNRKGFTLTELLGTIVVLGIVVTSASIIILSVIKKTQAKTTDISDYNLINSAKLYVTETQTKFNKNTTKKVEYKCISVQELLDFGYYNEDMDINKDMLVYIERDINTKVYKDGLLINNDKENIAKYCDYIEKIKCPVLKETTTIYDGQEHTININKIDKDLIVRYKTNLEDTWTEEIPVRKEVGTTKVYVEVEDLKTKKVKYCELTKINISEKITEKEIKN